MFAAISVDVLKTAYDVRVLDAQSYTQQRDLGILIESDRGVEVLKPLTTKLESFDPSLYASYKTENADETKTIQQVGLSQIDFDTAHTYIDPNDAAVQRWLQTCFLEVLTDSVMRI